MLTNANKLNYSIKSAGDKVTMHDLKGFAGLVADCGGADLLKLAPMVPSFGTIMEEAFGVQILMPTTSEALEYICKELKNTTTIRIAGVLSDVLAPGVFVCGGHFLWPRMVCHTAKGFRVFDLTDTEEGLEVEDILEFTGWGFGECFVSNEGHAIDTTKGFYSLSKYLQGVGSVWGQWPESYFETFDFFTSYNELSDYWAQCLLCGEMHDPDELHDYVADDGRGVVCNGCIETWDMIQCEMTSEFFDSGRYSGCSADCHACSMANCPNWADYNRTQGQNKLIGACRGYSKTSPQAFEVKGKIHDIEDKEIYVDSCLFVGLEVETVYKEDGGPADVDLEEQEEAASALLEMQEDGEVDLKEDGSLGDEGVEFVSTVLIDALNIKASEYGSRLLQNIYFSGAEVDSRCGGHIHFDRAAGMVKASDILGLAYMVDHMGAYIDEALLFGREFGPYRDRLGAHKWAEIEAQGLEGWDALEALNYGSHGYWLNIGENTWEIRLFSGTTSWPVICKRINLVIDMLKYARLLKDYKDADVVEFLQMREDGALDSVKL